MSLVEDLQQEIAGGNANRLRHLQAARDAWTKIDRPDLVKQLDDEFGPPSAR